MPALHSAVVAANVVVTVVGIAVAIGLARPPLRRLRRSRAIATAPGGANPVEAPAGELSPAMASILLQRRASRRTVAAALVELADRGLLEFEQTPGRFGRASIAITVTAPEIPRRSRLPATERQLFDRIRAVADDSSGRIPPNHLLMLDLAFQTFRLELFLRGCANEWLEGLWHLRSNNWLAVGAAELLVSLVVAGTGAMFGSFGVFAAGLACIAAALLTMTAGRASPPWTERGKLVVDALVGWRTELGTALSSCAALAEAAASTRWLDGSGSAVAWAIGLGLRSQLVRCLAADAARAERAGVSPDWPRWLLAATGPGPADARRADAFIGALLRAADIEPPFISGPPWQQNAAV